MCYEVSKSSEFSKSMWSQRVRVFPSWECSQGESVLKVRVFSRWECSQGESVLKVRVFKKRESVLKWERSQGGSVLKGWACSQGESVLKERERESVLKERERVCACVCSHGDRGRECVLKERERAAVCVCSHGERESPGKDPIGIVQRCFPPYNSKIARMMIVRDLPCQALRTSSRPLRDSSGKFVHRPQNVRSADARQVEASSTILLSLSSRVPISQCRSTHFFACLSMP